MVNDSTTEWCFFLDVPYETAYWQVDDSKEKNGSFNVAMIDAKRKLLDLKYSHYLKEIIEKIDLMLLINIVWNKLFARIDMNKNVITDRGSGPYNRNILTLSLIRTTMTETDKLNEMNYEVVLSPSSSVSTITTNSSICNNMFSSNSRYSDSRDINLNVGIAASVTDSIVQHADRLSARERSTISRLSVTHLKIVFMMRKKYLLGYVLKTVRLD